MNHNKDSLRQLSPHKPQTNDLTYVLRNLPGAAGVAQDGTNSTALTFNLVIPCSSSECCSMISTMNCLALTVSKHEIITTPTVYFTVNHPTSQAPRSPFKPEASFPCSERFLGFSSYFSRKKWDLKNYSRNQIYVKKYKFNKIIPILYTSSSKMWFINTFAWTIRI